jgi:hypothetical protein
MQRRVRHAPIAGVPPPPAGAHNTIVTARAGKDLISCLVRWVAASRLCRSLLNAAWAATAARCSGACSAPALQLRCPSILPPTHPATLPRPAVHPAAAC